MIARRALRVQAVPTGFGVRLCALRLEGGHTLDALAAMTGLDKGYLSRVEREQKSPSLAAVLRLAAALDAPVGELFGERVAEHAVRVVRRGERVPVPLGEPLVPRFEALSRAEAALEAFVVYPAATFSEPGDAAIHPGEELLLVLSGTIEMRFIDRGFVLEKGDCAQFPGHLPHRLRQVGERAASALIAVDAQPGAAGLSVRGDAADLRQRRAAQSVIGHEAMRVTLARLHTAAAKGRGATFPGGDERAARCMHRTMPDATRGT